jgi:hypothetical protein
MFPTVSWLGPASESYLRRLADTDRSLTRQVRELLLLVPFENVRRPESDRAASSGHKKPMMREVPDFGR